MTQDATKFVQTTFGTLAYKIDGQNAGGPPLLLLQRFRGTMDDWDPEFIAKISVKRQVVRFDNAGVGSSRGEVSDTVTGMAEVAVAFLNALKFDTIDLLGWSLGGYIAQLVALNAPSLIRKLVIAGSGPGSVPEGPPPDKKVGTIALKEVLTDDDLAFLFSSGSDASRKAIFDSQARISANSNGPAVTLPAATVQRAAIGGWWGGSSAARGRLAELKMPILVANGVKDVMIPAYSSYIISQEAPNVKLVLYPDAGHGFLFQHADEFVREVDHFLG